MEKIKKISFILLVQIVSATISITINLYLAWQLTPSDKGAISILILIPGLLAVLASLGFQNAIVYIAARQEYPVKDIIGTTLFFLLTVTTLGGFLCYLILPWLTTYAYGDLPIRFISLSLVTIPVILLMFFMGDLFWVINQPYMFIIARLLPQLIYAISIFLLVGWLKYGLAGAIGAYVLGFYLSAIFVLYLIYRLSCLTLRFNIQLLKQGIVFSLNAYVGRIGQQVAYRLDMPLLNFFWGTTLTGFYSVALPLSEILWYIPNATSYILFPLVAQLGDKKADSITPLMVRHSLFLSVFAGLFVWIGSWVMINSFLPLYVSVLPLLLVLIFGSIVSNVFQLLINDLMGRGLPKSATQISLVGLLVGVVVYVVFISYWGAWGAAWASTLTYLLESIFALVLWCRKTGVPARQIFQWKLADFGVYQQVLKKTVAHIRSMKLYRAG